MSNQVEAQSPFAVIAQSFQQAFAEGKAKGEHRRELRQAMKHLSTTAVELRLLAVERRLVEAMSARHEHGRHTVADETIEQLLEDWSTIRRALKKRGR